MREVTKNNHQAKWIELIDAKYNNRDSNAPAFSTDDLKELLYNFDVCPVYLLSRSLAKLTPTRPLQTSQPRSSQKNY